MAETFGAAAAAAGLLEQVITLFKRISDARQRQADLPRIIGEHMSVVKSSKSIVDFVRVEPSLASPQVKASIDGIKSAALALTQHLAAMHSHLESNPVRGFAHQLFSGTDDERQLSNIISKLTHHKLDLTVNISLVNVGLVQGYGNAVKVNTAAVEELNVRVKALLGDDGELRIAKIVNGRPRDANGMVPLQGHDLAQLANLSEKDLQYTDATVPGSSQKIRRIQNNIALKKALQVNAPVGQDIWMNMDVIVIENNIADVGSAMYNYPISSSDFLQSLKLMRGGE